MSLIATNPAKAPYWPLFTPLSQAIAKDVNMIFYLLIIALTGLVLAVKAFGLVALTLAALAMVPVMFALIITFTMP